MIIKDNKEIGGDKIDNQEGVFNEVKRFGFEQL